MNPELKQMLEKLPTDELMEVQEVIDELISINRDSLSDDPGELKEQEDFAQDNMIPYNED